MKGKKDQNSACVVFVKLNLALTHRLLHALAIARIVAHFWRKNHGPRCGQIDVAIGRLGNDFVVSDGAQEELCGERLSAKSHVLLDLPTRSQEVDGLSG